MASRTQVILISDLSGEEIDGDQGGTVEFAISGVQYRMDLTNDEIEQFNEALSPYVENAERIGGRRTRSKSVAAPNAEAPIDNKAVRAWAASNGIELSSRGRIPADIIQQYRDAGN